MRRALPFALFLLMQVPFATAAANGPFGVTMGGRISDYPACERHNNLGWYICETLPEPHPEFEFYLIQHHPSVGVCFVKGVGRSIRTDRYGTEIRWRLDELRDQLALAYGAFEAFDVLRSDSTWAEPIQWTMSIKVGDRTYGVAWSGATGATMKDHVTDIFLLVETESPTRAYLILEFYFENEEDCDAAINSAAPEVF